MNHDDMKNALPPYHDGELTPERAEQVEHHLGGCEDCRNELAGLQHIASILASPISQADTEMFVQRVMARLPEPTVPFWQQISAWWKIPVLAVSALLIVSVGPHITESAPSASTLLCGENTSNAALSHLCSEDTVQSDEMVNLIWGDL